LPVLAVAISRARSEWLAIAGARDFRQANRLVDHAGGIVERHEVVGLGQAEPRQLAADDAAGDALLQGMAGGVMGHREEGFERRALGWGEVINASKARARLANPMQQAAAVWLLPLQADQPPAQIVAHAARLRCRWASSAAMRRSRSPPSM